MSTIEQKRAKQIYEQILSVPAGERDKYGGMALKLPVLVRSAGLVQALAFLATRKEEGHKLLLTHLAQTLGCQNSEELLQRSRESSLPQYTLLTRQVLAALVWYKRFAQSVLGVESGADVDTGATS